MKEVAKGSLWKIVVGLLLVIFAVVFTLNAVTTVAADEIVVKQNFIDGNYKFGIRLEFIGKTSEE